MKLSAMGPSAATPIAFEAVRPEQTVSVFNERRVETIREPRLSPVVPPMRPVEPVPALAPVLTPAPPRDIGRDRGSAEPLTFIRSGPVFTSRRNAERPVEVHIGEIEIQVTQPAPAVQRPASTPARRAPTGGFDAYRDQRTYRRRL
jgi:hypothetical protein